MNCELLEILTVFAKHQTTMFEIHKLQKMPLTERDFADELFESFPIEERRNVYLYLSVWNRPGLEAVLRRRLAAETDFSARMILAELIDSITGVSKPEPSPFHYTADGTLHFPERPESYKRTLAEAVSRFAADAGDRQAGQQFRALEPAPADFTDELFAELTSHERQQIYTRLLPWFGDHFLKAVLQRRLRSETNPDCRRTIAALLGSLP